MEEASGVEKMLSKISYPLAKDQTRAFQGCIKCRVVDQRCCQTVYRRWRPDWKLGVMFKVMSILRLICALMTLQLQGKFIESRTVDEIQERPSRMFAWSAFLVSQIPIEIPWNTLGSSLLFFCSYWAPGFDSSRASFSFLFYCVAFPLYYTTFGQPVVAISYNGTIASRLVVAVDIPPFSLYLCHRESLDSSHRQPIYRAPIELVAIDSPSEMSCGAYMSVRLVPFGRRTRGCRMRFNASYEHRWRDFGVVLGFVGINVLFFFFLSARRFELSCSRLRACTFFGCAQPLILASVCK